MRALQSVLARHGKDYAAVVPRSLQWKLFENRRNRRALSLPLGLVEPIEQTRRCINRDLRGDLDHRGDSSIESASMGAGEYFVGCFCRWARVDPPTFAAFQRFLDLVGGIRNSAHDRHALHL